MTLTLRLFASLLLPILIVAAQPLDLSGYRLVQTSSSVTITLPSGTTIAPGGYLIVARNTSRSSFETAWGVTLGTNVTFVNGTAVIAGNGFPVINGDETFTLQNVAAVTVDGPTPAILVGQNYRRASISGAANDPASWTKGVVADANPGSGMTATNSGKLVISEFSDATAFANEFVEIFYDATPLPNGPGDVGVAPSRWKFSDPTMVEFVLRPGADTVRAFRFVKPASFTWSMASAEVSHGGTAQVSGDTVTISGFAVAAPDSQVVRIPGVTVADTTNEFEFRIESSADGSQFNSIALQPKVLIIGSPRTIAAVKAKLPNGVHTLLGKWAVTRGVVTVAGEFGGPSYIQDASGGMAIFDSSVTNNVNVGDDIEVMGVVAPFNDLFELTPCVLLKKISEGNSFDTTLVTIATWNAQVTTGVEPLEGRLVRVNGLKSVTTTTGVPATSWAVTGSGTNYLIVSGAENMQVRISPRVSLANLPTPPGDFDIIGVVSQFSTTYQLMPRSLGDVISLSAGPRIVSTPPYESDMTPSAVTLSWKTDVAATSFVRYGTTPALGGRQGDPTPATDHVVTLTGLSSATPYYVQLESSVGTDTTRSATFLVSTASAGSSGQIDVWFNKSVNTSVSEGESAQTVDFEAKLYERINAATSSIDAALYSLSGQVGARVAQALLNAKARGVRVRVIGELDNQGTAPWTTLKNGGIPVIDDGFDATNGGFGLHHNKFFVFDNRDTTSEADDWVWTGSWNATDPGTADDMQNVIAIQDKALANAFTMEFEEMWGSSTETPNASASRFGARKLDNTPHRFIVAGTPVEASFSPSDRVTSQIIATINKATQSIHFALLTMTRNDIANALTAKLRSGVSVRGILDNKTDQGSEFDTLKTRGVDVLLDINSAALHHKYVIIDGVSRSNDQWVLTGSHNWSSAAENSNGENTLILKSRRVANLYLQEFKARYIESGGTGNVVLAVEQISDAVPSAISLSHAYPNPFNPSTTVRFTLPEAADVRVRVFDLLGRPVAELAAGPRPAGTFTATWEAGGTPSGTYLVVLEAGARRLARKVTLIR